MGHFVTLIEIRVHLIRVNPGHISKSLVGTSLSEYHWMSHSSGSAVLRDLFRPIRF